MCEWCRNENKKDSFLIHTRCFTYWESLIKQHRHNTNKRPIMGAIRVLRRDIGFLRQDLQDMESRIDTRKDFLEDLLEIEEAENAVEDVKHLYEQSNLNNN